nr:hypothetical protein [Tanacetum cinerariifolium]
SEEEISWNSTNEEGDDDKEKDDDGDNGEEGDGDDDDDDDNGEEVNDDDDDQEDEGGNDKDNKEEGRGIQMTQEFKDSYVTLTPVNPDGQQQSSSVSSQFVTSILNPTPDAGMESIFETTS